MNNPPSVGLQNHIYRSYLIRFWQSNEQGCWRASAQCVQTGTTLLFGTVNELLTFLQAEVEAKRDEEKRNDSAKKPKSL